MSQKNYKKDEAIKVIYQAAGAETGATIDMEIYDESGAKDVVNFPDVVMSEIGASGRYEGSFTPDAIGDWSVQIQKNDATGKVVKHFSVGDYNVSDVGSNVAVVDGKVDALDTKVDTVNSKIDGLTSPPMVG